MFAAARVRREAGARVTTNVQVRDLDLVRQERVNARHLEVVVDGLPLFHAWSRGHDTGCRMEAKWGPLYPAARELVVQFRCAPGDARSECTRSSRGRHGRARLVALVIRDAP